MTLSCQCVNGQAHAVTLLHPIAADGAGRKSEGGWSTLLVACGLWSNFKGRALPSWRLPDEAVAKLSEIFDSQDDVRRGLPRLSASEPEPPSAVGDDFNNLLEQSAGQLRRAKRQYMERLNPSSILGHASVQGGSQQNG